MPLRSIFAVAVRLACFLGGHVLLELSERIFSIECVYDTISAGTGNPMFLRVKGAISASCVNGSSLFPLLLRSLRIITKGTRLVVWEVFGSCACSSYMTSALP